MIDSNLDSELDPDDWVNTVITISTISDYMSIPRWGGDICWLWLFEVVGTVEGKIVSIQT